MRSRLLAASAALALAVPTSVLAALPAQAEPGSCIVTSELPTQLAITSSLMSVPLTVDDPAGCMDWVSYDVTRSDGAYTGGIVADYSGDEHFSLGSSDGPGRYSASSDAGYDLDSDDLVALDSNTMDARYDSRFTLYSTRKGKSISFELRAKRYSYDALGYVAWSGAQVHVQRKAGSSWVDVATFRTGSRGSGAKKVTTKKAVFRAVVEDSATVWGGYTRSGRR